MVIMVVFRKAFQNRSHVAPSFDGALASRMAVKFWRPTNCPSTRAVQGLTPCSFGRTPPESTSTPECRHRLWKQHRRKKDPREPP